MTAQPAKWRSVAKAATGETLLPHVRWCASYLCHLRGLQFTRRLPPGHGLLFVTGAEGRAHTSIHMFFVFYSIAVIWMDREGRVVDKKLARPWRPYYASSAPAQYYLEALPEVLERVQVGEVLTFDTPSPTP